MQTLRFGGAVVCALAIGPGAMAQSGGTFVDAKSNIFGYGVSTPASGGGGGVLAVVIDLLPGASRTATFGADGGAWWGNTAGSNGPDGGLFNAATNLNGVGPISGFASPFTGQLVGVFIEAGDISALGAPSALSYPDAASLQQASYAPGLRQVFYIGDGLTGTGSGSVQSFAVPDGAAKLVLGIADGFGFAGAPGWYDDNTGGYDVGYSIVPAPGAMVLVGVGGVIAASRRRR